MATKKAAPKKRAKKTGTPKPYESSRTRAAARIQRRLERGKQQ